MGRTGQGRAGGCVCPQRDAHLLLESVAEAMRCWPAWAEGADRQTDRQDVFTSLEMPLASPAPSLLLSLPPA